MTATRTARSLRQRPATPPTILRGEGLLLGYTPPTCDPKQEVTNQQREVLAKVYSRAPDYMKGKLCRLTQLFVTGSTMGSNGLGLLGGAGPAAHRAFTSPSPVRVGDQEISRRSRKPERLHASTGVARQGQRTHGQRRAAWGATPILWIRNLRFLPDSRTSWATPWSLTPIQMGLTRNIRDGGERPTAEQMFRGCLYRRSLERETVYARVCGDGWTSACNMATDKKIPMSDTA